MNLTGFILWFISAGAITVLIALCLARLILFIYDYPDFKLKELKNKTIPAKVNQVAQNLRKWSHLKELPADTIRKTEAISLWCTPKAITVCTQIMKLIPSKYTDETCLEILRDLCLLDYLLEQRSTIEKQLTNRPPEGKFIQLLRKL
jgi:hypothetical protein